MSVTGFVNAFKSVSSLERTVERCKLMMDCNEGKMVVTLICRYGIIKTFNIVFIECETLQAVYNTRTCTNHVCTPSRVLYEAVSNFRCTQEEVTLSFTPTKAVFKTHMDEPDPTKIVHTVVTLQPGEFESYNISKNTEITFCLKELKALLLFTEPVCMCVRADFTEAGSPVILTVDNKPMFEGSAISADMWFFQIVEQKSQIL
ncbi:hypothetical protein Pcinc_000231 [Petrolisthes cinctipes]|uniref:Uncharacterized protein n=1 Tax=Petrolisthes cinctipes TaxID=88211 RepID=A0AAE1GQ40_PETCI|nr:hypothetical protein Pcinc_000231 [Petrolisthes cinctipes]